MSIIRAPRPQGNFYLLDKRISEDRRLSWAARGLLVFLLGKPDHWCVSTQALINETADSGKPLARDGVRGLVTELIGAGYIVRTIAREDGGKLGGYNYHVSETPQEPEAVQPGPDKPAPVQPGPVNPPLARTDKKQELNGSKDRREAIPDWLPLPEWQEFEAMRRAKGSRAPYTAAAANIAMRELGKLHDQGQDIAAVLNQSILNGWSGVFPVKQQHAPIQRNGRTVQTEAERQAAQRQMISEAKQMMGFAVGGGDVFEGEALERF